MKLSFTPAWRFIEMQFLVWRCTKQPNINVQTSPQFAPEQLLFLWRYEKWEIMKWYSYHKDKSSSHITVFWIMVQYCFVKDSSAITLIHIIIVFWIKIQKIVSFEFTNAMSSLRKLLRFDFHLNFIDLTLTQP